jgi:uncharacterized protein YqgC (DUF456 family)
MPTGPLLLQTLLETLTLFVMLVGLFGLIVPVFPGLTVMWIATLVYALIQNAGHNMTGWGWFAFIVITLLMLGGNVVDNIIITRKMRDHYIPWSSIAIAFIASIIASLFLTPIVGLIAAPLGLFLTEYYRLKNPQEALNSAKAYMIGWGWAFGARFIIGLTMIGSWMLWAWI